MSKMKSIACLVFVIASCVHNAGSLSVEDCVANFSNEVTISSISSVLSTLEQVSLAEQSAMQQPVTIPDALPGDTVPWGQAKLDALMQTKMSLDADIARENNNYTTLNDTLAMQNEVLSNASSNLTAARDMLSELQEEAKQLQQDTNWTKARADNNDKKLQEANDDLQSATIFLARFEFCPGENATGCTLDVNCILELEECLANRTTLVEEIQELQELIASLENNASVYANESMVYNKAWQEIQQPLADAGNALEYWENVVEETTSNVNMTEIKIKEVAERLNELQEELEITKYLIQDWVNRHDSYESIAESEIKSRARLENDRVTILSVVTTKLENIGKAMSALQGAQTGVGITDSGSLCVITLQGSNFAISESTLVDADTQAVNVVLAKKLIKYFENFMKSSGSSTMVATTDKKTTQMPVQDTCGCVTHAMRPAMMQMAGDVSSTTTPMTPEIVPEAPVDQCVCLMAVDQFFSALTNATNAATEIDEEVGFEAAPGLSDSEFLAFYYESIKDEMKAEFGDDVTVEQIKALPGVEEDAMEVLKEYQATEIARKNMVSKWRAAVQGNLQSSLEDRFRGCGSELDCFDAVDCVEDVTYFITKLVTNHGSDDLISGWKAIVPKLSLQQLDTAKKNTLINTYNEANILLGQLLPEINRHNCTYQ
eukprot:m.333057 g.333057  ORF g.333057 m.333057 type:complete len:661 (+) comp17058_c0_seq1:110-2092(+)